VIRYSQFDDDEDRRPGVAVPIAVIRAIQTMWDNGYSVNEIVHFTGRARITVLRYTDNRPQPVANHISRPQRSALLRRWSCVK